MKLNISRIFETSKSLSTKAGNDLKDFINFAFDAFDQTIGALKGQLTFRDNFFCEVRVLELSHNTYTRIDLGNKSPIGILPLRVISDTYGVDFYHSYTDTAGKFNVKIGMTDGSSSPSGVLKVSVVIFFE